MKIAIYTSAHGYGHASRSHEVAKSLTEIHEGCQIYFMSAIQKDFFAGESDPRIFYRYCQLDVGMRQVDSLTLDIPDTLHDLRNLAENSDRLVEREAAFLKDKKIDFVLIDLPHLAFKAAASAGIQAWGLSNFSWDWIYELYLDEMPGFATHIESIREAYRKATGLFRLPFVGGLNYFGNPIDVPLIARKSKIGKGEARGRMNISKDEMVILFSFGGIGRKINVQTDPSPQTTLIITDPSPDPGTPFRHFSDNRLKELGLRYCDLVCASDLVVSKPGYGIVSECIANRTALLYTPRGHFREYPVLTKGIRQNLPSLEMPLETLQSTHWLDIARKVMKMDFPPEPDCSGAKVVAKHIIAAIKRHTS